MMAQPIPPRQVVPCAGRVINLPMHYGCEIIVHRTPPRNPTPGTQPLNRLAGSQWGTLSVLQIDIPKSYRQANV